jgi:site-specific recombinase XerD
MALRERDPTAFMRNYLRRRVYLRQTRGASAHTVRAYRDALKLFFLFLADHARKPVAGLTLDDVRVNTVLAFLQHIETKRGNSAITRNWVLNRFGGSGRGPCCKLPQGPGSYGS